jgi:hypothetical protein
VAYFILTGNKNGHMIMESSIIPDCLKHLETASGSCGSSHIEDDNLEGRNTVLQCVKFLLSNGQCVVCVHHDKHGFQRVEGVTPLTIHPCELLNCNFRFQDSRSPRFQRGYIRIFSWRLSKPKTVYTLSFYILMPLD